LGTEIRTFYSLKEMNEYILGQIDQHKALFEDYSQWLGTLLRDSEANHKNEPWYQKSVGMQKNARNMKKGPAARQPPKKNHEGKTKGNESPCWIQSGDVMLCSTEQGEAEILFEAVEEINTKIQGLEKFKTALQQLERIGLGKNVNYVAYVKDDVPEKIVLRNKISTEDDDVFKFSADFTAAGTIS
jgi:hypothetical protein